MKLNATVIGIKARSDAHDGKRRVELKPEGAYGSFIVPSDDLGEDEQVVMLVLDGQTVRDLLAELEFFNLHERQRACPTLYALAAELRPDEPPPLEAQTEVAHA